ncbi:MAG: hypothetical protein RLZZ175_2795 [Bacteroidota bacterium]|jgi:hypothetical protein
MDFELLLKFYSEYKHPDKAECLVSKDRLKLIVKTKEITELEKRFLAIYFKMSIAEFEKNFKTKVLNFESFILKYHAA